MHGMETGGGKKKIQLWSSAMCCKQGCIWSSHNLSGVQLALQTCLLVLNLCRCYRRSKLKCQMEMNRREMRLFPYPHYFKQAYLCRPRVCDHPGAMVPAGDCCLLDSLRWQSMASFWSKGEGSLQNDINFEKSCWISPRFSCKSLVDNEMVQEKY